MSNPHTPVENATHKYSDLDLGPTLYSLDGEELSFYKKATGIHDEDKLRQHILSVQAEAYKAIVKYDGNGLATYDSGHVRCIGRSSHTRASGGFLSRGMFHELFLIHVHVLRDPMSPTYFSD